MISNSDINSNSSNNSRSNIDNIVVAMLHYIVLYVHFIVLYYIGI